MYHNLQDLSVNPFSFFTYYLPVFTLVSPYTCLFESCKSRPEEGLHEGNLHPSPFMSLVLSYDTVPCTVSWLRVVTYSVSRTTVRSPLSVYSLSSFDRLHVSNRSNEVHSTIPFSSTVDFPLTWLLLSRTHSGPPRTRSDSLVVSVSGTLWLLEPSYLHGLPVSHYWCHYLLSYLSVYTCSSSFENYKSKGKLYSCDSESLKLSKLVPVSRIWDQSFRSDRVCDLDPVYVCMCNTVVEDSWKF